MVARTPPQARQAVANAAVTMTFERFLRAHDGEWAEWVDGRVVRMSPVSRDHSALTVYLVTLIKAFVDTKALGLVLAEPYVMRSAPGLPGRSPDILFVAKEHEARLRSSFLDGPADLVVEIVSPDSRTRDRRRKLREYEEGGVREYWLPDPAKKRVDFYVLDSRGMFQPSPASQDGTFRSAVLPGFWLRVGWLWERPPLLNVLKEWGLV
jgi:Uma2 family endonuclease